MQLLLSSIITLLIAYLLGSIPFGVIFGKLFRKIDIRSRGTGNIGASNAFLTGGPQVAIWVLIGDIAKGSLAVYLAKVWLGSDWMIALCAFAVILGHDYSIFLKGKGGKGLATATGALLVIDVYLVLFSFLIYLLLVLIFRFWMLTTVMVLSIVPILMWLTFKPVPIILFGIANALLSLYQHRQDLVRIFLGKEPTAFEWMKRASRKR